MPESSRPLLTHRKSVTYRGQEIANPLTRLVVVVVVVIALMAFFVGMLVTSPVWLAADFGLKHSGRQGFVQYDIESINVKISREGWRRV